MIGSDRVRPFVALISVLILAADTSFGDVFQYAPKVGDEYRITKSYETSNESSSGSSGSSSGADTIIERVIGAREGGLEIEYDFPKGTSEEVTRRSWQFPVRVFRPSSGPMRLLNRTELEARVEVWLQTFGVSREACGTWTFTWNAFRVDCDPQSVIDTLNSFDLRVVDLEDGAPYEDAEAIGPGTLEKTAAGAEGETFTVTLEVDPDVVRHASAESDVVVGEIMNEPVTLEAALSMRTQEEVSGTILVTLDADLKGNVWRRTRVTEIETKLPHGESESRTATEIVERQPLPGPSTAR